MEQKRKAVILCLAALLLLTGVLIWQGKRQFPALETKNAAGDIQGFLVDKNIPHCYNVTRSIRKKDHI